MNVRLSHMVQLATFLLLFPMTLWAQGFSGLGAEVQGFATPQPDPQFSFPADHGAHPDYRIEWWYLTANLQGPDGTAYGLQWTLFRTALAPGEAAGWSSPQIWFAHAAVTTPDAHHATERFARGGIGQAGVQAAPFHAWIDEWSLKGADFDAMSLTASGPDFGYDMALTARGPLVFHGDGGYSVKSQQGQASYYYSQPYFDITGTLSLPDGVVAVTGSAWLDREWSSQPLGKMQTGWDWFSLSFDEGAKLMGFQLRQTDGGGYSASTWIAPDGTATALPAGAFAAEPLQTHSVAGRDVPVKWQVRLPARGVDVNVSALNRAAWMGLSIPYWEGPVRIEGSHTGVGYLEMTGYE
ncbi:iron ABC transporter permease [Sulfitobacter sp. M57]|uniref:lipocalin-like domain-containing protein n=2 Tax=unclassified Sulfitobacter TaxID=196795 RepID=UPI0023E31F42|nr:MULTISPECIES: lipocalin-like domain-containing protein [unclassified Sulfitobacter]MDF3431663.1 iron ABC transporter permease [Sulfitobacter sp. KE42]MDF3519551.1 iron ABC transporter permease [Sulfitobacter sp. M74]MDF3539076.1 iron ABC transporter permease [Sulfitobacter sp. M62]MDF3413114.1 iron ABC transporter permease [Sulfitobacter sp. KE5]MDF3421603.1 iron ABC transporter permease [Sulfitobacter sp. KE43]